jgi:aminopeptidase N
MRNDRAAKMLINLAFGFIADYEVFLGPFPWKEFNIVQVNTYGYGQAPPATMFITNEAFSSNMTEIDRVFSQGINERFAHEIAHQYWGTVVKWPVDTESWLSESFAEMSAAMAIKRLRGETYYNQLAATWRGNAKASAAVAPIPYVDRIGGDYSTAADARINILYNKGPLLLDTIRKQLGDEKFLVFLKSYQKTFAWKFGTTKDVIGLLGFMTKQDWNPFFDQYYWGTAMPQ